MKNLWKALAIGLLVFATGSFADVFNMGGVRNPDGTWTGLASIDSVFVGNVGNSADMRYLSERPQGTGRVNYAYKIGKYEVTVAQYTEFLNAVARTDTYGLYDTYMANTGTTYKGCNIQRGSSGGGYVYRIGSGSAADIAAYGNRPVNYVSWGDAARFCNWLQNGQPNPGWEDSSTTEDGVYFLNGIISNNQFNYVNRITTGWKFAIPSEDEWYKAAYYNGSTGSYCDYATGGSSVDTTKANYDGVIGNTTNVGLYPYQSYYGTYDQAGNVREWNESNMNGNPFSYRIQLGGAFSDDYLDLSASKRDYGYPSIGVSQVGFRIVMTPEPATIGFLVVGMVCVLRRKRA